MFKISISLGKFAMKVFSPCPLQKRKAMFGQWMIASIPIWILTGHAYKSACPGS
jgi:hypothetical protein